MSAIVVETPPAIEPVRLGEMKSFLGISATAFSDDALITGLITAARIYAEIFTRRALITTGFVQYHDNFPYMPQGCPPDAVAYKQQIKLLRPVCQSVDRICYIDVDGNAMGTKFLADTTSESARVFPLAGQVWPETLFVPNAVAIHFTAGYGYTAECVPTDITDAIKQYAKHWYAHRESINETQLQEAPRSVDMLLWKYRFIDYASTQERQAA